MQLFSSISFLFSVFFLVHLTKLMISSKLNKKISSRVQKSSFFFLFFWHENKFYNRFALKIHHNIFMLFVFGIWILLHGYLIVFLSTWVCNLHWVFFFAWKIRFSIFHFRSNFLEKIRSCCYLTSAYPLSW